MAQSVKCFPSNAQSPGFKTQHCTKLGVVMHTCNSSTWEVEAGSQVQMTAWVAESRDLGERGEGREDKEQF